jgi:hypothetical protein
MSDLLHEHFWACWWLAVIAVVFITDAIGKIGKRIGKRKATGKTDAG